MTTTSLSRAALAAISLLAVTVARADAQTSRATARGSTPTLILTGGKVFTADSTHPWAEALAIRGERIVAVGTTADVRRLAGRATREIALGGRVVIPGINDAHDHVGDVATEGQLRTGPSPTPDPTLADVLDSVRAIAARTPAGTWITGPIGLRVLDDTAAGRAALDRAAPAHPVFLSAWWGHGALVNSAALRTLGIADDAADPLGGWYERDARGRLTGRLDEYARWGPERRVFSMRPERAIVAALRAFADSSLRMGVTTVQNMSGDLEPALTVRAFRDARLPIRVRLIRWSVPNRAGRNEGEWNAVAARPAPRVVVSGRKWVVDGTPIERNALRRAAYSGSPEGRHGRLNFPADTIRAILAAALRPGAVQPHLHVVGDSTAALVLSWMEALAPDSVWRPRRVRFEHAPGLADPSLLERAHRLGIVIAQPRAGTPLRTWLAAGIPLAYGSDMLRNPFYNMMAAVAPRDSAQAITREQAVTIYTRGSAYAEFAEREKGTLAPGMLADLAVLSQDIFTVPAAALPGTTSVLTVVGGRIVRDVLTSPAASAR
ncbi:MAG TPA: amidohydrolase [Gemmatimonadaceae bacterium]|nr:amidohydrolase [Gemmatimonadaceae bacterium]